MTALVTQRRLNPDRVGTALVVAGLLVFVGVVYVVTVLGGGALIGRTSSPDTRLSILATLVVALGLGPVQSVLQRLAHRVVAGERELPYDVLSRFSASVTQSHDEQVPLTMARVLAEGTGAVWAQVWLLVGDAPVLAATWPEGAAEGPYTANAEGTPEGQRTLLVRLAGETLGALRIQERPFQPLTPVERRLFDGLAGQAGHVLQGARLRAELAARLEELSVRSEELRSSRGRVVEAQDAERRRLERDIHDGAQQHLVALAVNLRLAQTLSESSPEAAARVLAEQVEATDVAIETLVDLSRGIYPGALSERGIGPALTSATSSAPTPVEVRDATSSRLDAEVELAVYFCCLEAIQNALKHAGASHIDVALRDDDGGLTATVSDNGAGFDVDGTPGGSGLVNMRDRLDAVGGTLAIQSSPTGTVVTARVRRDGSS
ncbi:sensor histidine kinase [Aeromicrobium sp. NPDC092404]|uniref:sensor histidine kinase n=1 Tax=Aeromicrobium sp. NPDC092404 TaxID=3154976 RepID=UPI00341FF7D2